MSAVKAPAVAGADKRAKDDALMLFASVKAKEESEAAAGAAARESG